MLISISRVAATASLLSLAAFGAQAQSSVSVYGLIDLSAGQYQLAGGNDDKVIMSGNMSTSYIGFGGKEDLGGGLSALFALESFFLADTGHYGRFDGDVMWARAANVGLSSNQYGTLRLGRNTPAFFLTTLIFNAFGDSFGFSPSILQYYLGSLNGDSGWSNAVRYVSPNFGGASVDLIYGADDGDDGRKTGANVLYFGDKFSGSLAWQKVEDSFSPGYGTRVVEQTAWQAAAAYDFGAAKLFGQYGVVDSEGPDRKSKIAGVGVKVPVGAGDLLGQYGWQDISGDVDAKRKTLTLGYDHNLSKRTDLYLVLMRDEFTGLDDGNTYMVGMRHRF